MAIPTRPDPTGENGGFPPFAPDWTRSCATAPIARAVASIGAAARHSTAAAERAGAESFGRAAGLTAP